MKRKQLAIAPDQLRRLAEGHGACFATDRVTVDNAGVGYLYREEPEFDDDSGWRFFAGDESPAYLNNPDHLELYDVNLIANLAPDIVPLLHAPIGSAFERDPKTGEYVEVEE